ncbi:hypothetical protein [Streptomyces sp. NPDC018610]|uniref:hypothetical protein n=1 Tax=Streptomyces sp. NPDC018610 TaxID=3365049 RepID=UPI00379AE98A
MGSLRLTVCAGLLVAGAFAPALDTAGAGSPADRTAGAAPSGVPVTPSSPAADGKATVVPRPTRPAPSASPGGHAVPETPGTAHAVTGLVLAAAAAAAVVLLPRAAGPGRPRRGPH